MKSAWLQKLSRALRCETTIYELVSPLRQEECVRRLRENLESTKEHVFWSFVSNASSSFSFGPPSVGAGLDGRLHFEGPLVGSVDDTTFALRTRFTYRVPFSTIVRGSFKEEPWQTRLQCRFSPHGMKGFLIGYYALVGIVFTGIFSSFLAQSTSASTGWLASAGTAALLFPLVLIWFSRLAADDEEAYLRELLLKTLNAYDVSEQKPPTSTA
jgi:hypothetical protein